MLPCEITCSPSCAFYTLKRHAKDELGEEGELQKSIEHFFYCTKLFSGVTTALQLLNSCCDKLSVGTGIAETQELTNAEDWGV